MDMMTVIIIVVVLVIAGGLFVVTHKATEAKIVQSVEAKFADLKAHLSPQITAIESTIEPGLQASISDLHAKVDAIRAKLGGVYTDFERSQIVQDLEQRASQAKAVVQALANAAHDADALRAAIISVPPNTPTVVAGTTPPVAAVAAATGLPAV